jgi:hypothetical protein
MLEAVPSSATWGDSDPFIVDYIIIIIIIIIIIMCIKEHVDRYFLSVLS